MPLARGAVRVAFAIEAAATAMPWVTVHHVHDFVDMVHVLRVMGR